MRLGGFGVLVTVAVTAAACSPRDKSSVAGAVQQSRADDVGDLLTVADAVYGRAEYDSAGVMYDRVVRDAGAAHDSLRLARALTGQAGVAKHRGRFDNAKSIGEHALEIKRRLGNRHEIAKSLNALGLLAQDRGQLAEATQLLTEAVAVAEAARDSEYIVKARGNLGMVYQDLGEFDRARAALMAFRDAAAAMGNETLLGNALNNLGMLETRVGDPDRAIAWLTDARAHYVPIDYIPGLENSSGQLGYAYAQRGELSKSLAYLDTALTIATAHGMSSEQTDDLQLMAQLYADAGDHRHALDLLQRAHLLADSMKMITKLGQVALTEAVVYNGMGNLSLARTWARKAVELQRTAGARMYELYAELFLAEVSQRAGDTSQASASLAAADSLTRTLGWRVARIHFALGAARVADAARRPRDVLALLDSSDANRMFLTADEQAETEALRARAFLQLRQHATAAAAGRRAIAGFERIRRGLGTSSFRSYYLADRATAYSDLVIALLALGRVDEAFLVADQGRGRALVEHLGAAARELPPRVTTRDGEEMERLLRRIDELVERLRIRDTIGERNRLPASADGPDARELFEARRTYEALLERATRASSSSPNPDGQRIDVSAIRQHLAPDEALLEYLSTSDKLLLFVVTRKQLRWIEIATGSFDLEEHVRLTRDLINSRNNAVDGPLHDLYDKLIAPAKSRGLLDGIRSLVIVPHAALTYLPFAALRQPTTGGTARYLVQDFAITTITSASALPMLRNRLEVATDRGARVFAPFPGTLPSTADEAKTVGRQLAGSRVVLEKEATEPAIRDALARSRIVHIASHGVLNPDSPMFSNVEIAEPTRLSDRRPDNDGRLETYEVLSMNVRSWLVFLSGCETALGYSWSNAFNRREDYATLAQSFLFAGARNVVATLWPIDDRGAAEFARSFYGSLSSSSPSTALAAAQRNFIAGGRYSAPYYWAGYVLSGSGDSSP